ncbi:MAG: hypothetical protein V1647_00190, partial [Pseudomonadota bacterium]
GAWLIHTPFIPENTVYVGGIDVKNVEDVIFAFPYFRDVFRSFYPVYEHEGSEVVVQHDEIDGENGHKVLRLLALDAKGDVLSFVIHDLNTNETIFRARNIGGGKYKITSPLGRFESTKAVNEVDNLTIDEVDKLFEWEKGIGFGADNFYKLETDHYAIADNRAAEGELEKEGLHIKTKTDVQRDRNGLTTSITVYVAPGSPESAETIKLITLTKAGDAVKGKTPFSVTLGDNVIRENVYFSEKEYLDVNGKMDAEILIQLILDKVYKAAKKEKDPDDKTVGVNDIVNDYISDPRNLEKHVPALMKDGAKLLMAIIGTSREDVRQALPMMIHDLNTLFVRENSPITPEAKAQYLVELNKVNAENPELKITGTEMDDAIVELKKLTSEEKIDVSAFFDKDKGEIRRRVVLRQAEHIINSDASSGVKEGAVNDLILLSAIFALVPMAPEKFGLSADAESMVGYSLLAPSFALRADPILTRYKTEVKTFDRDRIVEKAKEMMARKAEIKL